MSGFRSFSSWNCKEFAKLPKQLAPRTLKFENLVHIDLLSGGAETQLSLTQKARYRAAGCANSRTARTPSPAQQHGGSGLCGRLKSRFCDPFRRCRSITSPWDRAAPAAHRRRLHQRDSTAARRPSGGQSLPLGTWKRSWGCAVPGVCGGSPIRFGKDACWELPQHHF